jgi:hypothetical protein
MNHLEELWARLDAGGDWLVIPPDASPLQRANLEALNEEFRAGYDGAHKWW